eukprot:4175531-Pleurochrysis_carterae.AAC.1
MVIYSAISYDRRTHRTVHHRVLYSRKRKLLLRIDWKAEVGQGDRKRARLSQAQAAGVAAAALEVGRRAPHARRDAVTGFKSYYCRLSKPRRFLGAIGVAV